MAAIDLNLLTALDALLAEGSVVGAARRLNLSDSAMSRTLSRLRAATGDPLLVRAGRGMVPTPYAEALRERVRELALGVRAVLQPAGARLDLSTLERTFTIRANEGFIEAFGGRLVTAIADAAPSVRLHFVPKPDKSAALLRDGLIDLEIGVPGETGPEMRIQTLFRDHFLGVAREGHPLFAAEITPERYAACRHVVTSRHGHLHGPVDKALATHGLSRRVVAVVAGFPAALAIVAGSDLVTEVTAMQPSRTRPGLRSFPLPVATDTVTVSQIWHPRLDADPGHRWLRGRMLAVCREAGEPR